MSAPGRRARSVCVVVRGAIAPRPQNIGLTCKPARAPSLLLGKGGMVFGLTNQFRLQLQIQQKP